MKVMLSICNKALIKACQSQHSIAYWDMQCYKAKKRLMLDLYIHIFSWLAVIDNKVLGRSLDYQHRMQWWWSVNAGNIAFEGDQQLSTSPASWPPTIINIIVFVVVLVVVLNMLHDRHNGVGNVTSLMSISGRNGPTLSAYITIYRIMSKNCVCLNGGSLNS